MTPSQQLLEPGQADPVELHARADRLVMEASRLEAARQYDQARLLYRGALQARNAAYQLAELARPASA